LLDCQMPLMDGFQAATLIRSRETEMGLKPLKIIAVTGEAEERAKSRCFESGMNILLKKPLRRAELEDALQTSPPLPPAPVPAAPGIEPRRARVPKFIGTESPPGSGWDFDQLEQLAFGKTDRMKFLAEMYLREAKSGLGELKSAIEKSNLVEARRLAHRLAGSSATCGAERISEALRKIEHFDETLTKETCLTMYQACIRLMSQMETEFAQKPWSK
jgi:CheY-like chemotaxis protein